MSRDLQDISYGLEPDMTLEQFRSILKSSGLWERRPYDHLQQLEQMLRGASIIVAARDSSGALVGVSRAVTDYGYCCYLSDLAVDKRCQGQGIGRTLIAETHRHAGPHTTLILLSAPAARTYYPRIGMQPIPSGWMIPAPAGGFPPSPPPAQVSADVPASASMISATAEASGIASTEQPTDGTLET
mmetsp:Transcript_19395/g.58614  ORF Transcript_19395/g.58614 Transcript_19395/m.58614 type:complete len:186 (+) Transcript_19395:554-1111(+)|eukprot:CAMPEP_0206137194 /NCGR_PEP_ID=MMETSP1473-20131121/2355_1 /ASSEMBLY_ACC=CAM_ASM_001109 /TAXON_ID=1461547 /ORGANISM="Stichococcus sp, Strain RCC1054" /LENGTH=185 /DNA_ID=CAMNT_0053530159 /DNA_START=540 /DNA_END=1097 /DNA_ORIENTATION=+